jgi:hypothetical protein
VPPGDGDERREAWLKLMLPLLAEAEALVPLHGTSGILNTEHRHDLLAHGVELSTPVRLSE